MKTSIRPPSRWFAADAAVRQLAADLNVVVAHAKRGGKVTGLTPSQVKARRAKSGPVRDRTRLAGSVRHIADTISLLRREHGLGEFTHTMVSDALHGKAHALLRDNLVVAVVWASHHIRGWAFTCHDQRWWTDRVRAVQQLALDAREADAWAELTRLAMDAGLAQALAREINHGLLPAGIRDRFGVWLVRNPPHGTPTVLHDTSTHARPNEGHEDNATSGQSAAWGSFEQVIAETYGAHAGPGAVLSRYAALESLTTARARQQRRRRAQQSLVAMGIAWLIAATGGDAVAGHDLPAMPVSHTSRDPMPPFGIGFIDGFGERSPEPSTSTMPSSQSSVRPR